MLPGLGNSGPQHWQTLWEKNLPRARRVEQADWERPDPTDWEARLAAAVGACEEAPVLVAHSLACTVVARWARRAGSRVRAAMLVAPADVDAPDRTPVEVRGFAPMPHGRLPFTSIVVASRDDPFVAFTRARAIASAWGAEFVDAGAAGHLNTASGHGPWPEGRQLLERLLR
jgi:predicted alpha/beta hydrolase family esterase